MEKTKTLAQQSGQRREAASGTDASSSLALKKEIHKRLVDNIDLSVIRQMAPEELKRDIRRGAEEVCDGHSRLINRADRDRIIEEVVNEVLGLGPLEALMNDPSISDILINGPKTVYVERRGQLEPASAQFDDEDHLLEVVQRIASRVGRRIDESTPMVDARLADGSRVNAIIRPLALDGALVSIRRFSKQPMQAADLIARESATKEMLGFLAACIAARLNIIVSGGTGSGKTTLLNMLSGYIPDNERIVTIEDAAELQLQQPHVARMETRPANLEGKGEITTRDLVRNALRMRPDRIIIGECRGPEAFDMLQAMNTGHNGSLTTIHANDTRDAIARLEMLVGMAGMNVPLMFIHKQIASAIHIVVQAERLPGGGRKIIKISEVTGLEGENICMHDLFVYNQTGVDEDGQPIGNYEATGIVPVCLEKLHATGVDFPRNVFERRTLQFERADRYAAVRKD